MCWLEQATLLSLVVLSVVGWPLLWGLGGVPGEVGGACKGGRMKRGKGRQGQSEGLGLGHQVPLVLRACWSEDGKLCSFGAEKAKGHTLSLPFSGHPGQGTPGTLALCIPGSLALIALLRKYFCPDPANPRAGSFPGCPLSPCYLCHSLLIAQINT